MRPLTAAVRLADRLEEHDKQFDVARVARSLIIGLSQRQHGVLMPPEEVSQRLGDPDRLQAIHKAATSGSTLREGAAELGTWRSSMREFLNSLADVGAADAVLRSAVPAPWISDQVLLGAIVVGEVSESQGIPVRRITASAPTAMVEHKLASLVVGSDTYFSELGASGLTALNAELRKGVILGTDTAVFTQLAPTPAASGGDPIDDVAALLTAVEREAGDRLVFVAGASAFDEIEALPPSETPLALTKWPVFPTSSTAVAADSLWLLNASSLRFADRGIEIDASNEATLQMDSAPSQASDSPPVPTNVVSLWQSNSTAVRVLRQLKLGAMRSNAVAEISGIAWTFGSP